MTTTTQGINLPIDGTSSPRLNLDNTNDPNKWLGIIGLVVLGLAGIVAVLCISDIVIPETTRSVPVVGELGHTINSSVTSFFSNIIDFFRSKSSDGSAPGNLPEVKPEVPVPAPAPAPVTPPRPGERSIVDLPPAQAKGMSRANSWDSDRTIRPLDPASISEALGNSRENPFG